MKLLVTGSTGFIGRALCAEAVGRGLQVRAASRYFSNQGESNECVAVGEVGGNTNWLDALQGCDVVVHLAARAHVTQRTSADSLTEFRKVNLEGTLSLARQAAALGARRFVFISSVGVNGANTSLSPFAETDKPTPHSDYAVSKFEAEMALRELAIGTGMEIVIIRPPLVYGPNAPGSFGSLMRWLRRGIPLPLGAITENRRSLVALDNLVDFIVNCACDPRAANQTFLVSDGDDISTTGLLQRMSAAMNRPAALIPVPSGILTFVGTSFGKEALMQSLTGSLQVDIRKARELLNWNPPFSVNEGLRRAVNVRA
jgi:nucleoside-diphosphate-sugar epimerase